jgi:hypothetical protein
MNFSAAGPPMNPETLTSSHKRQLNASSIQNTNVWRPVIFNRSWEMLTVELSPGLRLQLRRASWK